MATDIYNDVLKGVKEYAIETDNTRFLAAAIEPDQVWKYLDYFADFSVKTTNSKGKEVKEYPFHRYFKTWGKTNPKDGTEPKDKVIRSYVANAKSAIRRHEMLAKVLEKEEFDYYRQFHLAESESMDAYALQVLLDIVKTYPKALDDIDAKIAAWEDQKEKEKAEKAKENKDKKQG